MAIIYQLNENLTLASPDEYSKERMAKATFVEQYISPLLFHANTGYESAEYLLYKYPYISTRGETLIGYEEYVAVHQDSLEPPVFYVDVTGDSKYAIMKEVVNAMGV